MWQFLVSLFKNIHTSLFFKKELFGGVRDKEDPRDLRYEEISGEPVGATIGLPDNFILNTGSLSVKNQGSTSSCGCQAASFAVGMATGKDMSARYAFNVIKTDSRFESSLLKWGQFTRDAAKIAVEGICTEELAPQESIGSDTGYLSLEISEDMKSSAKQHERGAYVRVDGVFGNDFDIVRRFIYTEKLPVLVSMPWYVSYNEARSTGVLPYPSGRSVGHIVLCIGWEGDNYVMVNSYSDNWGKQGKFLMPKMYPTWDCWGIFDKKTLLSVMKVSKRDVEKEKENAYALQRHLYSKFATYDKARSVAGKNWLSLVNAMTYRGYTAIDIENWCYAVSREKKPPFNLNKNK